MIEVDNISKKFKDADRTIHVFDQLSFTLTKGKTVALMGQSGAGKSTLLHVLGGFDRVDSGRVSIDELCLTTMNDAELSQFRRSRLGMVFQQFNLIDSLSALDNISFVRRLNGLAAVDGYTQQIIEALQLQDRLHHYPHQLSGGEQQRVAIARALASRPSVLLADEPTGNLDETTAALVMNQLMEVVALCQTTLFLVTHSPITAGYLQEVWHLEQGRLRCQRE